MSKTFAGVKAGAEAGGGTGQRLLPATGMLNWCSEGSAASCCQTLAEPQWSTLLHCGPSLLPHHPQRGSTRLCTSCLQLSCPLLTSLRSASACPTTGWQAGTLPLSSPLPVLQHPVYLKLQAGEGTSQKMMSITNYSTSWVLPHGCAGAAAQLAPCSPLPVPRGAEAPLPTGGGGFAFLALPCLPDRQELSHLLWHQLRAGTGKAVATSARPRGTYKTEYFLTN